MSCEPAPPRSLYLLSAIILGLLAWSAIDASPLAGLVVAMLLALPAALLLHAAGIRATKRK